MRAGVDHGAMTPSTAATEAPLLDPAVVKKYEGRCYRKQEKLANGKKRVSYARVRGGLVDIITRECYDGGGIWYGRLPLAWMISGLRKPKDRERGEWDDWNPCKPQRLVQFTGEMIEKVADALDFDLGLL